MAKDIEGWLATASQPSCVGAGLCGTPPPKLLVFIDIALFSAQITLNKRVIVKFLCGKELACGFRESRVGNEPSRWRRVRAGKDIPPPSTAGWPREAGSEVSAPCSEWQEWVRLSTLTKVPRGENFGNHILSGLASGAESAVPAGTQIHNSSLSSTPLRCLLGYHCSADATRREQN